MPRQQSPLSLEFILLGFLEQKPIHGYDLYKKISNFEPVSLIWRFKQSQLYALLDRLEKDGLVKSTLIAGENYPNRKQYEITQSGEQVYSKWLSSPVPHERDIRIEFLAKIYFCIHSNPKNLLPLIENQRCTCLEWLNQSKSGLSKLNDSQVYERIVFDHRCRQIQATLDWLDAIQKEINNLLSNSGSLPKINPD